MTKSKYNKSGGYWGSSCGYWFLVHGLKWPFFTFTLVYVTHLAELFNVGN